MKCLIGRLSRITSCWKHVVDSTQAGRSDQDRPPDAISLAKLHRAGELTAVWVPDPQAANGRPAGAHEIAERRKVRLHNRIEARSRHATASPPKSSKPSGCSRSCHYSRTSFRPPASASAIAILSLCRSRQTYVVDLSKTRLLCIEARCQTGATLDKPAYCETGRQISGEHVV
jgi:hypothetical protein